MNEHDYDKLLNIKTHGKGSPDNVTHYYPYEPTPYEALEILFNQYEVNGSDQFVDFGCGLGRLNFYLHYHFRVKVTGIEMDELSYRKALKNKDSYAKKIKHSVENITF
ncbi:methyltransferase [Ornithinibacillus scapharcae]|uniref:methyltransferase n=1 Tax=Ornithinibacillus scapharcae TaxID=1147159 RepID=UPI000225ADFA|nr:methyltransferase [Ornithinibacillus scapharcae]